MKKRKNKIKGVQISTVVIGTLVLIIILNLIVREKINNYLTEANSETIYPSLYKNRDITANAVISDEKFKNKVALRENNNLASLFSLLISKKSNGALDHNFEKEYGAWLWTPLLMIEPEYKKQILDGAKERGINTIYLSIDSYLDIYAMPDGKEKEKNKERFDSALRDFIRDAWNRGIAVDAEAGWKNWAEPGHQYKPFAILDYVIEYNSKYPEKLRGFQYDVEPYMLPYYKESKKEVLHRFVTLIHESAKKISNANLKFSVVVPEFYDGYKQETPRFFYAMENNFAIGHLIRVLEEKPGSSIIVMAYRNFANGKDGAVEISKEELGAARKSSTKIIVAQEIGDVPPPFITFHNTSLSHYEKQRKIINENFAKNPQFAGTSAHYINALLTLK